MSVPFAHVRHQGANLGALARVAVAAIKPVPKAALSLPGPELRAELPPRDPRLVADFVRWCGGDPEAWSGQLPPHFFPQWGFPLLARTLDGLPHPVVRVLNQGCRITVAGGLPADEPLHVTAQLLAVDDEERRVRIHQRLTTGPAAQPDAIVADVYAVVPKPGGGGGRREPPTVPGDHAEIAAFHAGVRAGWEFALLTGDFNPVHWLPPYARMAGFKSVILHGFATLAQAGDAVARSEGGYASIDVRFVRPLRLPAEARVFLGPVGEDGSRGVAVGEAVAGPAVLLGRVTTET